MNSWKTEFALRILNTKVPTFSIEFVDARTKWQKIKDVVRAELPMILASFFYALAVTSVIFMVSIVSTLTR